MKLIIHAGLPKNGSSSIQEALKASKRQLLDQGVQVFDTVNGLPMPRALTDSSDYLPPKKSFAARYGGQMQLDDLVEENWEAYESFKKEKNADFLLVSSEMLPSLSEHNSFWERLTDGLTDVEFIIYFRNPIKFYGSLINTMIQAGEDLNKVFNNGWKMNSLPPFFTIHSICLAHNYPLRVKLFDRKALLGGDVVKDFSFQIGEICSRNVNLQKTPSVNQSFSHEALFALYVFNKSRGADITAADWEVRKSFKEGLRELDRGNTEKTKKLTFDNPLIEQWLISGHEEQLEILKQNYGISFKSPEVTQDQQGQKFNVQKLLWKDFYSVTKSELFAEYFSYVMEVIEQERGS